MRLRQLRWVLALGATLACAGTARAEGPGVKLGERLVLHPGIAAELRYDSNFFFQSSNEVGMLMLRVLPTFDLATRPPQREAGSGGAPHKIDFRLHAGLDYRENLYTTQAGINKGAYRMFGVQAGGLLSLFPAGKVSVDLFDNFVRTTQPPYTVANGLINRDTNELGVRFRFRPGGGRLELDAGYAFGLDFFEDSALQDFNLFYHRAWLRGSWKFLPKTAVFIDVSTTPYLYRNPGIYMHPNSYPLRAIAGLTGLITAKLTVNLWAGYANGFYATGPSPNTGIGGIDFRWKPTMLSTGILGYKHEFVNSLLGSYYDLDMAYLGWVQAIWRFTGNVKLSYQNNRYKGIPAATGVSDAAGNPITERTDNYLALNVRVDYAFKDWLAMSLGYDLQYNNSNAVINFGPAGLVPVNYLKHEVSLRLSVLY